MELLTDAETRDTILDDPRLFQTVLERSAPLTISPQLYFYILVRHVLKETGLNQREASDYVASMLEHFSQTARLRSPADGRSTPIQYVSDMLVALRNASSHQEFLIRAHMGNYALFITGIFHETVESRFQRGAPALSYYEEIGRSSFGVIAQHRVARTFKMTSLFESLSARFHEVRLALNRLAGTLLHLDDAGASNLLLN